MKSNVMHIDIHSHTAVSLVKCKKQPVIWQKLNTTKLKVTLALNSWCCIHAHQYVYEKV